MANGRRVLKAALRRFGAAAVGEVVRLVRLVRQRWQAGGVAGFVVALTLCLFVAVAAALENTQVGRAWVVAVAGQHDGGPWPQWLARLPGSLVAPALDLPVWGSLLQILVVVGIAEATVGRRLTIAVGAAGHLLSSLAGRAFVLLASGSVFGLPGADSHELDNGPSAATVALSAYLAVVLRCPIIGTLVAIGLIAASLMHSGLAGREHAVAGVVGVACAGVHLYVLRLRARRATTLDPAGEGVTAPVL